MNGVTLPFKMQNHLDLTPERAADPPQPHAPLMLPDSLLGHSQAIPKEIEGEWIATSSMIALALKTRACNTHENCDGSCSNVLPFNFPWISLIVNFVSMLMDAAPLIQSTYVSQHRDAGWVDQQNLPCYQYSPINSLGGEIRLVKVKKGFFRSDVVECEIVATYLDQSKGYQALSYCWGSSDMRNVMLIDGKRYFINDSLNAALKAFREIHQQGCLLWSDYISINQANKVELNEQVLLMRRIYTEAASTFVYLGPTNDTWSLGLDLMILLGITQSLLKSGMISSDMVWLPPEEHPCWVEYLSTFNKPWFSRTWILQEIVLSKNATMCMGRLQFSWKLFEISFHFLNDQGFMWNIDYNSPFLNSVEGFYNFRNILEIRKIAKSPDASSLLRVLRATRSLEVSDPRDKIIAVLGLVGELDEQLKSLSNYELTTAQVFHQAALYLMGDGNAVEVLGHAGLQRQAGVRDIPSWVPDWYVDNMNLNRRPLTLLKRTQFNAGSPYGVCLPVGTEDTTYPRELLVTGVCHHKIVDMSQPCSGGTEDFLIDGYVAVLNEAQNCLTRGRRLVYDDVEEAFARTVLVNHLYQGGDATPANTSIEDLIPTFRAALQRMVGNLGQPFGRLIEGRKRDAIQTCIYQICEALSGRRFAITDTGYMSLVPSCAEVGDAVAILFGFKTPFTIRIIGECGQGEDVEKRVYAQLVGDAYMHGVMEGEAVKEASVTDLPINEIVLV